MWSRVCFLANNFLFVCPHLWSKSERIWPRARFCLGKLIHRVRKAIANNILPRRVGILFDHVYVFQKKIFLFPKQTNEVLKVNLKNKNVIIC